MLWPLPECSSASLLITRMSANGSEPPMSAYRSPIGDKSAMLNKRLHEYAS